MMNRVWIKDVAKHEKLMAYKELLSGLTWYMNSGEMYCYLNANYIMDYKLLVYKITKRIKWRQ